MLNKKNIEDHASRLGKLFKKVKDIFSTSETSQKPVNMDTNLDDTELSHPNILRFKDLNEVNDFFNALGERIKKDNGQTSSSGDVQETGIDKQANRSKPVNLNNLASEKDSLSEMEPHLAEGEVHLPLLEEIHYSLLVEKFGIDKTRELIKKHGSPSNAFAYEKYFNGPNMGQAHGNINRDRDNYPPMGVYKPDLSLFSNAGIIRDIFAKSELIDESIQKKMRDTAISFEKSHVEDNKYRDNFPLTPEPGVLSIRGSIADPYVKIKEEKKMEKLVNTNTGLTLDKDNVSVVSLQEPAVRNLLPNKFTNEEIKEIEKNIAEYKKIIIKELKNYSTLDGVEIDKDSIVNISINYYLEEMIKSEKIFFPDNIWQFVGTLVIQQVRWYVAQRDLKEKEQMLSDQRVNSVNLIGNDMNGDNDNKDDGKQK